VAVLAGEGEPGATDAPATSPAGVEERGLRDRIQGHQREFIAPLVVAMAATLSNFPTSVFDVFAVHEKERVVRNQLLGAPRVFFKPTE